ncbi:MAG TPA: TraB/GumN family protein [Solimonas sp.]|nr:TraB/GumN family protein [Solimonas sp.]
MRRWPALLLSLAALAAPAEPPAPFLWQVQAPGGGAVHWLMGSIHLLPDSAQPLPPALVAAYQASAGLILESDLAALGSPEVQLNLLMQAASEHPAGIKAEMPPPDYARLQAQAAELGMPMNLCDNFKPWFCAMSLEVFSFQHEGFRPELGVDQQFYERAGRDGKPVAWLEEPKEHLALFYDMPPVLSQEFLAATLAELGQPTSMPQELLRIWRGNDQAALAGIARALKDDHPQTYQRLLAGRNRLWAGRLQTMLGAEPQLVIVGAAHLAGPDSLPALLQRSGFQVTPSAEPRVRGPL